MQLNGSNYLQVPDSQSLDMNDNVTITVWVKISIINTYQDIVSKGSCNSGWYNDSYVLCVTPSTALLFYGDNSAGSSFAATWVGLSSSDVGVWTQLAMSIDSAAGKIDFYKDGKLIDEQGYSGGIQVQSQALLIGGGQGFNFTGLIDNVRIYHQAMTASQISNIYAMESGRSPGKDMATVSP